MSDPTTGAGLPGRRRSSWSSGLGAVVLAAAGIGIVVAAASSGSPVAAVLGTALLVVGVALTVAAVLEWRLGRARPGATLGRSASGAPATVLRRATWAAATSVVLVVVTALALLGCGAVLLARSQPVGGVLLVVLGLALLVYAAPLVRGLSTPGGVFLAADGVTYAREGSWWHAPWDDIVGVVPGEPTAVVLRDGAAVTKHEGSPPGWRALVRAPGGVLGVETRFLAVEPEVLAFLVLAYRDRPDLRSQLGTAASLQWDILRPTG